MFFDIPRKAEQESETLASVDLGNCTWNRRIDSSFLKKEEVIIQVSS